MFGQRLHMLGGVPPGQQRGVYCRVKRLDPAIEHLREMRDFANIAHVDTGRPERLCSATGRDEIPPEVDETFGEID
ncbi:MAG: hypothetical protein NVSMB53_16690 [Gemmatimonadaceae bacterium]